MEIEVEIEVEIEIEILSIKLAVLPGQWRHSQGHIDLPRPSGYDRKFSSPLFTATVGCGEFFCHLMLL
jgi:hypothetical protein